MEKQKTIPLLKVYMAEEVDKELLQTIHSGYIGEGPRVERFENELKEYFGNPYLITVNAGTSALQLAYHMAQYQDSPKSYYNNNANEIITTPITCTATNTPILTTGAKVVWADVDPITGSIDPDDIEKKITDNTKAIAMVHWGGAPCEIGKINAIANKYGIKTVEDGAHSIGMTYDGKPIGNHSDYTMISLQAIKQITSIDGGILLLKNEDDYKRAKLLRWYGIDRTIHEGVDLRCELDVAEAGYKFHMNDVCATVGSVNFRHIKEIVGRHRENTKFYDEAFTHIPTITLIPKAAYGESSCWLYTFHVNNRDELMKQLNEHGIMASKVHARNDTHSMFAEFKAELPGADAFNNTHLCIPVGWWVTDEQREYIADTVIKYAK